MGVMGSVALSVLMIPIVIRSSEEVLKIVPNHLREAAYALGTPKWRTIVKVVLPTAFAGLITGVMIATARIIGETAPLLVTTGVIDSINTNPFQGRMQNLAVYAYSEYRTAGRDETGVLRPRLGGGAAADRYRDGPQPRRPPRSTAATEPRSDSRWRKGDESHVRTDRGDAGGPETDAGRAAEPPAAPPAPPVDAVRAERRRSAAAARRRSRPGR